MKGSLAKMRLMMIALVSYIVLMLPLAFNGAPIYWYDSVAYLHGGGTALSQITGITTKYSNIIKGMSDPQTASPGNHSQPVDEGPHQTVLEAEQTMPEKTEDYRISSARSPYYAVFLAGVSSVAGLKGPVYLQALMVLLSCAFLLKAVFKDALERPAFFMLCALAMTTAGTFAAVLLPDILAPLGLLSFAVLFAFWFRLSRFEKGYWYAILVIAIVSHMTHLAVTVLLFPFAMLLSRLVSGQRILAPSCLMASAIILGMLGNAIFSSLVERQYGYKPQSFPMIAASIITDGSGRAYLEATCPQNGYVYCDHLDTQAREVDQYLWSRDPELGVYALADRETKDKMSVQQWRLLIDTLQYDFAGQFRASLNRMFHQLRSNSLNQFAYGDDIRSLLLTLPPSDSTPIKDSATFGGTFPFMQIGQVSQWIAWGSLAALLFLLIQTYRKPMQDPPAVERSTLTGLIILTLLVLIGFIINAGLTGVASQPQGRYSARLLWLFPVLLSIWWNIRTSKA